MNTKLYNLDRAMIQFMHHKGLLLLRYALGIVFVWFGALKVLGFSPVADLVGMTVYWFPADIVVPMLGFWEMLVGFGLLFGVAMQLTLALFLLQMVGTFLVLFIRPDVAFQDGNPLLLTTIGEFVIKNLVLITAGLTIGGALKVEKIQKQKK